MNQLVTAPGKSARQYLEVVDAVPVLDTSRFEHMQRIANVMAQSTLIPESLYAEGTGDKKKELPLGQIVSNCFLVVNQAVRWGLDPFAVAQSVAVVRGKLCYEGKLVAAVLDAKLGVRLHYHFTGDPTKQDYRVFVSDVPWTEEAIKAAKPGMALPGARVVDGSVSEWSTGEKGPWALQKNYRRMLIYRGGRDWARFYEPAVLLGVYTPDELLDLADAARANRARDIEGPSVLARLQQAASATGEPAGAREGFSASHVASEAAALTGEPEIQSEPVSQAQSPEPGTEGTEKAVTIPSDRTGADGSDGTTSVTPSRGPVAASLSADEAEQPAHAAAPEAGADGSEAADGPPAASAPALSVEDRNVAMSLMEECVDTMLREATSSPIADRPSKVAKAAAAWRRERVPMAFVDLCLQTAERLVATPSEANKRQGREYLIGKRASHLVAAQ